MDLGRLSRRCLFVAFFAYLWIAILDAFPAKGPYSTDQEAQLRPHRQYSRDPNTTSGNSTTKWAVACVYPVSGIYTRMQRLLLYAVTAFVFLLRSYDWLIAVGLTFVLTYVSAACIHAFLLSTLPGVGPDFDVVALQGIIVSTTIAVYCYSIVSPRISNYAIAPLYSLWILAICVTSSVTFVSQNGIVGSIVPFVVPAACSADGKCNTVACSNSTSHGLFRSVMDQLVPIALEQWRYYNASDMVDWNGYYVAFKSCLGCNEITYSNGSTIGNFFYTSRFYLLYFGCMISMGVPVMAVGLYSPLVFNPSKSRNVLFFHLLITYKTFGTPFHRGAGSWIPFDLSGWSIIYQLANPMAHKNFESVLFCDLSAGSGIEPRHIYVAKLLASCGFLCSWSARIILLTLPVVAVIISEMLLGLLPESEAPWLVGQLGALHLCGTSAFRITDSEVPQSSARRCPRTTTSYSFKLP